ncbi:oligosaccharide flippase family protein [uncultured Polaribacter sp.]|uniref:oligosaccharide flippase family protein n=1 Tax=uncultured Polaribacter sp. TaxID=174711 RepID=UPI002606291B|nr:oligosaccharide flippase family protein [uncultured Polaribacter sp.]
MIKSNIKILLLKFSGSLFLFLITILISKNISLEEFGTYEVLVRISLLISTISVFGLPALINRTKSFYEAKKIFVSGIQTVITIDLIISIFSCLIIYIYQENLKFGLLIIFGSFFYPLYRLIGALYLKNKKYTKSILTDDVLFYLILYSLLLLVIAVSNKINIFEISLFVLISRLVVFLYFYPIKKLFFFKIKINIKLLQKSFLLFLQSFLQKALNNLPVILCGFLFTQQEAGVYALSVRLSSIYLIVLSSFNYYITPKISENLNNSRFKIMLKKGLLLFLVFSILIFTVNLFLSNIITSIWPEMKGEFLTIYFVVLLGYLVNLSTGSVGVILNMTGNEKKHLKVNLFSLILIIISFISSLFYNSFLYFTIFISLIMGLENILKLLYVRFFFKTI